jgi:Tol biopolymer transport system component
VLASSTADLAFLSLALPWHPNIVPAWSPDGLFIAVPGASSKAPAGRRVLFVDSRTGSTREVTTPNGPGSGLGWLDPHALVLNVAAALYGAQSQLFRVTYPTDFTTRLTNDPNDYAGISLTSDRSSLVSRSTRGASRGRAGGSSTAGWSAAGRRSCR